MKDALSWIVFGGVRVMLTGGIVGAFTWILLQEKVVGVLPAVSFIVTVNP